MDRPIKVVHMIGGGEYGGAENHIIQLIASFNPQEIDASVICFYESAFSETLREMGVEVTVLDQYHRFDPRIAWGLGPVLQKMNPDILHTHGVKANFFGRIVARRLKFMKVVTTVHSHLKHDYDQWAIKLLTYGMEYSTRRLNDYFIAVSRPIKMDLIRTGVAEERIAVIPNGIPLQKFTGVHNPKLLREELQLPGDALVVGTVARLRQVKGVDLLLEAAGPLCREWNNLHLVVIGDGPERGTLEQQAKDIGITDRVDFLGFCDNVEEYLPGMDVFANTSLSEGLPVAVLEAMAAKVPVLASGVGAIPDLIQHGHNGLIVEPGSVSEIRAGLERMLRDPEWRRFMSENGFRTVKNGYTTTVMSQRNQELYKKLLEE